MRDYVLPTTSNNGPRSSVTLRSNVFLRTEQPLAEDLSFLRRVHGRSAISRMLALLHTNQMPASQLKHILTSRQAAEWAWEHRCDRCGCVPEGPVMVNGHEEIKFRCPLGICRSREFAGKSILLDPALVDRLTRHTGLPLIQAVQFVLARTEVSSLEVSALPLALRRRPFTVALTPWQRYMLTNEQIEAALKRYLDEETLACEK